MRLEIYRVHNIQRLKFDSNKITICYIIIVAFKLFVKKDQLNKQSGVYPNIQEQNYFNII